MDWGREGFHMVGEVAGRLVDTIMKLGPETKVDMDLALQAEAFDVIGKVGYAVDFKATADLSGPGAMAADNITHGVPHVLNVAGLYDRTLQQCTMLGWHDMPLKNGLGIT